MEREQNRNKIINIMKDKYKYIVWVGGVPNYFNTLLDAQIDFIEWLNKGYKYPDLSMEILT